MKRHRRGLSKKGFTGLQRITNVDGVRVFLWRGRQYFSLRELVVMNRMIQMGIIKEDEKEDGKEASS